MIHLPKEKNALTCVCGQALYLYLFGYFFNKLYFNLSTGMCMQWCTCVWETVFLWVWTNFIERLELVEIVGYTGKVF